MELVATIVSGTVVYVAGRIIEKVFVDPPDVHQFGAKAAAAVRSALQLKPLDE